MRKLLFLVYLCLISNFAIADETANFNFDGAEVFKELDLKKNVFVTLYRSEDVPDTCSREVFSHYENVCRQVERQSCHTVPRTCHTAYRQSCHAGPQQCHTENRRECHTAPSQCRNVCHNGPSGQICRNVCSPGGTTCHDEPRRVCSPGGQVCTSVPHEVCTGGGTACTPYYETVCNNVARYRTETYACTRTIQIPYQELSHIVNAKVAINFRDLPQGATANENFTLAIVNDSVSLSVKASKKLLIYADKKETVEVEGNNKNVTATIDLSFVDLTALSASLTGIDNIDLDQDKLTFTVGKSIAKVNFEHKIKIVQKRMLKKDIVKLDAVLTDKDFMISELNGLKLFTLDLAKLNIKLKDKKHKVEIISEAILLNKKPLNAQDVPNLKQLKEIDLKL